MSNARNMARLRPSTTGIIPTVSMPRVPPSVVTGKLNKSVFPSGSVLQIQSSLNQTYNSATVDLGYWTTVPSMSVNITPIRSDSLFKIDIRWGGEVTGAWDVVFAISRNGIIIGTPTQEGTRMGAVGMPQQSYIDPDDNSTLEYSCYNYIDTPNTSSTITYAMVSKAWSARTLYTGSVVTYTTDAPNYERISTEIIVTEIAA